MFSHLIRKLRVLLLVLSHYFLFSSFFAYSGPAAIQLNPLAHSAADIVCDSHDPTFKPKPLEVFIHSDAATLSDKSRGTFIFRRLNGTFHGQRYAIVYIDSLNRLRFKLTNHNSLFDPLAPRREETDLVQVYEQARSIFPRSMPIIALLADEYCPERKRRGSAAAPSETARAASASTPSGSAAAPSETARAASASTPSGSAAAPSGTARAASASTPRHTVIIESPLFLELEWDVDAKYKMETGIIEAELQEFQNQAELISRDSLHGAQFFHGSSSASLLAFTEYGGKSGNLIPTGEIEGQGKIPFSGELMTGRKGINRTALSTVHAGQLREAIRYTTSVGWKHEEASSYLSTVDKSSYDYKLRGDIESKRITEWEKLTAQEKDFVRNAFPVLYGFKIEGREKARVNEKQIRSDIPGEVSITGGVRSTEIRVIFVPGEHVTRVHTLLRAFPAIRVENGDELFARVRSL